MAKKRVAAIVKIQIPAGAATPAPPVGTALGPHGVNVTVVHPGMTRTERTPETLAAIAAARDTTPEEVEAAMRAAPPSGASSRPTRSPRS